MICQKAMSKGTELIELGEIVEGFSVPPHPRGISLEGKLVVLKPLKASDYSNARKRFLRYFKDAQCYIVE